MTIAGFVPIVSASAIFLTRMAELAAKRDTIPGAVRENLTLRLFILTGALMIGGSLIEFLLNDAPIFWPAFIVGWMFALASFVIRRNAISSLGKFWSLHVEIRDNHEFVQSGPFRWMRHPTYFSMILELLGAGLVLNARYSFFLIPILFVPALLIRLRLEESALIEKFGDAYRAYQKTTPAIFPIRWPRTK